jgi:predicted nucleic acid-binding Zn ribbon protein
MECGGRAHLVQPIADDDELEPGDIVTYVCGDCAQRWDVVVDDTDIHD